MRIVDEFKTLKEKCCFKVELEPYYSTFKRFDDIEIFHTNEKTYSKHLFFNDNCGIIFKGNNKVELELFQILCMTLEHTCITKILIEDKVYIKVFDENKNIVQSIKC